MQFPILFSPIKVGSIELPNRLVVPPMGFDLAEKGGIVGQAATDYWVARAKGGWGLLTFEFTVVDPLGKAGPRHTGLWNDDFIPGFKQLTDAVHKYGAKIAIQLGHTGRQTTKKIIGAQPVSASAIPCPVAREIPRALRTEEVYDLVEKFGDAAVRARDAGFDVIEIHGAHGYLIAQFMSPLTNRRVDEFGGSFHNRIRFPIEIIHNVRRKIGASFPLMFRLSGEEKVPGGRTIDETRVIARQLVDAGIDAIDVSVGMNASGKYIISPAVMPPGFLLSYGEEVKKAVSVPVIAVGRINHPMFAEDAIESGKADLIAMGRASLADPELPNKVAAGQLDDISPCIACLQGCARLLELHDKPLAKLKVTCLVNPFCARESEMKIKPAAKSKKVVVVGGGPAGLEAAWVAAACGHQVTLYEKQEVPGGQFRIAAIPPFKQELARAISYYIQMCKKFNVSFKLGVEATEKQILAEKPDVVIIATGGKPYIPDIKGVTGDRVVTAWDILDGKKQAGSKVLIVGGGMVGCETADFLGEHLHNITLVEALPEIAKDVPLYTRTFLMQRLQEYGVKIETKAPVVEFLDDGIIINKGGKKSRLEGFDTIVLAMGAKPVNGLKAKLEKKAPELYVIGDALEPRQAIEAIEEGARVALKI
jgi:2,4-dienoyl-CoA reductase-like NADH-dependent reductase (Old Yellow Enzyme family)/NADPH-dependent glutamate synthase beta subunit-like oxidoreductase